MDFPQPKPREEKQVGDRIKVSYGRGKIELERITKIEGGFFFYIDEDGIEQKTPQRK